MSFKCQVTDPSFFKIINFREGELKTIEDLKKLISKVFRIDVSQFDIDNPPDEHQLLNMNDYNLKITIKKRCANIQFKLPDGEIFYIQKCDKKSFNEVNRIIQKKGFKQKLKFSVSGKELLHCYFPFFAILPDTIVDVQNIENINYIEFHFDQKLFKFRNLTPVNIAYQEISSFYKNLTEYNLISISNIEKAERFFGGEKLKYEEKYSLTITCKYFFKIKSNNEYKSDQKFDYFAKIKEAKIRLSQILDCKPKNISIYGKDNKEVQNDNRLLKEIREDEGTVYFDIFLKPKKDKRKKSDKKNDKNKKSSKEHKKSPYKKNNDTKKRGKSKDEQKLLSKSNSSKKNIKSTLMKSLKKISDSDENDTIAKKSEFKVKKVEKKPKKYEIDSNSEEDKHSRNESKYSKQKQMKKKNHYLEEEEEEYKHNKSKYSKQKQKQVKKKNHYLEEEDEEEEEYKHNKSKYSKQKQKQMKKKNHYLEEEEEYKYKRNKSKNSKQKQKQVEKKNYYLEEEDEEEEYISNKSKNTKQKQKQVEKKNYYLEEEDEEDKYSQNKSRKSKQRQVKKKNHYLEEDDEEEEYKYDRSKSKNSKQRKKEELDEENQEEEETEASLKIKFIFDENNKKQFQSFTKKVKINTTIEELDEEISNKYNIDTKIQIQHKFRNDKMTIDREMTIEDVLEDIKENDSNILYIKITENPKNKAKTTSKSQEKRSKSSPKESKSEKQKNKKNELEDETESEDDYDYKKKYKKSNKSPKKELISDDENEEEEQNDDENEEQNDNEEEEQNEEEENDKEEEGENDDEDSESDDDEDNESDNDDDFDVTRPKQKAVNGKYKYYYQTNKDDKVKEIELKEGTSVKQFKQIIGKKNEVDNLSNIKVIFAGKDLLNDIILDELNIGDTILFIYIRTIQDILLMTAKSLRFNADDDEEEEEED